MAVFYCLKYFAYMRVKVCRSCRSVVPLYINYPYLLYISYIYNIFICVCCVGGVVLLSFSCRSLKWQGTQKERTGTQKTNYVVLLKSFISKAYRLENDKNDKNACFYTHIEAC